MAYHQRFISTGLLRHVNKATIPQDVEGLHMLQKNGNLLTKCHIKGLPRGWGGFRSIRMPCLCRTTCHLIAKKVDFLL
ncbi:hypothetical protein GDO78_000768 [Eleutherodactylus coqui]|uniref:Uncharacterized protein n=1 Tax=Eleutherodactylus coqui TaxID=57060 RepID=A0A8J6FRN7_ELECQ|nr:hypothetical protein GDO78_000768 [Eleutherodactylus coqui]